MNFVYIIRIRKDGTNLAYVKTRLEAERICAKFPDVFMWETIDCLEPEDQ
jgi:hypothetical protein